MSRVSKRQTTTEKTRRLERASAKTKAESPCGRKPAQISASNITVTVLTDEQDRHARYRLRVTWPEVTQDIDGFPVTTIDRYIVHLQHSDDGSTWNTDFRRKVVDAKDGDTNTTGKAIFKGVRRRRYYRVRVRARDAKGCKSDLSDWTSSTRVGTSDTPSAVGTITRTRVGPRRIEFDWADVTDPDFDRYKVEVLNASSSGGTYSVVRTRYTRQSWIAVHVAEADKTKYWKVRVTVETTPDADNARAASTSTDSTADQADDIVAGGGATAAPSTPTSLATRSRVKAVLLRWQDGNGEPSDAQQPIRYIIHVSTTNGFTPSSSTRVGATDGEHYLVTTKDSSGTAFTKQDATRTFYFKVVAKNAAGTATSAQASGSPAASLTASKSATEDDADITEIRANRFIADDGTGDRIVIADTSSNKAKVQFVGGSGASATFTVGNAGNVTVTGSTTTAGKVTFTGGIDVPHVPLANAPSTADGAIFVRSTGTSYANYLYWHANGAWYRPSAIAAG